MTPSLDLDHLFRAMLDQDGSDLFLKVGSRPVMRVQGQLTSIGGEALTAQQLAGIGAMLMTPQQRQVFEVERELNFAFDRPGISRFRANVMWQQGTMALVIRRVRHMVGSFADLNLPTEVLTRLATEQYGLVLVTGATGVGKSTTVAAMLDYVNRTAARHIVTLEDPVEFQFAERQAIINQREVGTDTRSFRDALKNVLRQNPDVLFVSDIRDQETVESCLHAAEAGQLVLSCLHTINSVTTIERLVALFPPHQHGLIRLRLSLVLRGIVSLRLLQRKRGVGRLPVCEVLIATPTVRELVRQAHTEQLPEVLRDGALFGMQTFMQALYQRCRRDEITREEALRYADSPQDLELMLRDIHQTRDVFA